MKNEELLQDAIGMIGDDLIDDADRRPRRPLVMRWSAVACACLAVLISTAFFLRGPLEPPLFPMPDSCCIYDDPATGHRIYSTLQIDPTEDYNIFIDAESNLFYEVEQFVEKGIPKKYDLLFMGEQYTGIYETSALLPLSGNKVYTYLIEGHEECRVMVDAETSEIVKYVNFPFEKEVTAEQDYMDMIQSIVGTENQLSKYQYLCRTYYYIKGNNSFQSTAKDEFHFLADNEILGRYEFYFNKYVNDVPVLEHISANIDQDTITLELVNQGEVENAYDAVFEMQNVLVEAAKNAVRSNVKEMMTIVDISSAFTKLFVRGGVVCVEITSRIEYIHHDNATVHTAYAKTVSWFEGGTKIN